MKWRLSRFTKNSIRVCLKTSAFALFEPEVGLRIVPIIKDTIIDKGTDTKNKIEREREKKIYIMDNTSGQTRNHYS